MRNKLAVLGAVVLLVALALVGSAGAAGKQFPLMGQQDSPKASGSAALDGTQLTITARGLKPKAIYTVWFVNMQPAMSKEGAGAPPYAFTADPKGRATYKATLSESPIGKWQVIFIVRHPSG
ncbi:MAG: hypothetical protein HY697_04155, partial [Deltaproteobacteria bacterium]|nr:hypothetical protein [Deltaproteobacteria bacterium]